MTQENGWSKVTDNSASNERKRGKRRPGRYSPWRRGGLFNLRPTWSLFSVQEIISRQEIGHNFCAGRGITLSALALLILHTLLSSSKNMRALYLVEFREIFPYEGFSSQRGQPFWTDAPSANSHAMMEMEEWREHIHRWKQRAGYYTVGARYSQCLKQSNIWYVLTCFKCPRRISCATVVKNTWRIWAKCPKKH